MNSKISILHHKALSSVKQYEEILKGNIKIPQEAEKKFCKQYLDFSKQ